ncbi:MAG TPA: pentapeptide repeat-containing protein [Candidatus Latescibacteria bacterium]|nr:pentapeptide repeat-containing protein [Candidatus Latescibacterota bacterium]
MEVQIVVRSRAIRSFHDNRFLIDCRLSGRPRLVMALTTATLSHRANVTAGLFDSKARPNGDPGQASSPQNMRHRLVAQRVHVDLIEQGSEVWNQWRRDNPDVQPDLYAAHLPNADLSGMNLSAAILAVAVLYRADLSGADLRGADVRSANLMEATLRRANLLGADLSGAYCHRADLAEVDLGDGDLRGVLIPSANLDKANLSAADLSGAHLHNAKNLTVEQLCSVRSLWLAELHNHMSVAETHCPQLLLRPTD